MTFKTKKNFALFIIFFLLFLLIFSVLYYFFFVYPIEESKYLKNIAELRSFFTEHMKETVDYGLGLLGCQPKKYYYNNYNICFVCNNLEPCFGFGWVHRTGGERMNLNGKKYLKNYTRFSVEVADFYNDGLASLFKCVEKTKDILLCVDGITFIKEYDDARMVLNDEDKLEDVSSRICAYYDKPSPSCEEVMCSCGNEKIIFTNSKLFVYDTIE